MFNPDYYERKVFQRSRGILESCVISCKYYSWTENSDGSHVLNFFLEKDTEQIKLDKAIEYCKSAFRKASVDLKWTAVKESKTETVVKLPHISLTFEKKEVTECSK